MLRASVSVSQHADPGDARDDFDEESKSLRSKVGRGIRVARDIGARLGEAFHEPRSD
jgi:hypothetical protein